MSFTSVDFPEPETPVTAVKTPSGNFTVMFLRLFSVAPATVRNFPVPAAALRRHVDRELAGKVLARERARELHELVRVALPHDLAAVDPGARAEVHDAVREADRLLVVLDDDDRVPEVAHREERVDELAVVLRVEADGRLVEDVEDAHELAPICVARRMRCASPPESVADARASER